MDYLVCGLTLDLLAFFLCFYYIGTEGSANILHLLVLLSSILFYSCFFKSKCDDKG